MKIKSIRQVAPELTVDIEVAETHTYQLGNGCVSHNTTSKLFGLTEGAHLPARRQYLRWVQFKGEKEADGTWRHGSDPLLAEYEERGYPVRGLSKFPGMSIVGFPTMPLIQRLGVGDPAGDRAGGDSGNPVSVAASAGAQLDRRRARQPGQLHAQDYTDQHGLEDYRDIVLSNQPLVRCCSVMPSRPDSELGDAVPARGGGQRGPLLRNPRGNQRPWASRGDRHRPPAVCLRRVPGLLMPGDLRKTCRIWHKVAQFGISWH